MPGDTKHHTDKFRKCVADVVAKGKSEDSAYAICTTSLQDAGEPIFEGAEARALHLRGAVGACTTEMIDGREWLIVPTVALQEGVIHPVNAKTPEFVSTSVLSRNPADWNDHPLMVGHPTRNGKQCSAHDEKLLAAHSFGKIRAAKMKGSRLSLEALVDPARLETLNQHALLADLRAGKPIEVSVGAYVATNKKQGDWNGKLYHAEWLEIIPDHLAFLPGGRGACSLDMGCGAHRAAMHFVSAESIDPIIPVDVLSFTTLEGKSLDDRIAAVNRAVDKNWNSNGPHAVQATTYTYTQQVFDDHAIVRQNDQTLLVPYTMDGENVVLGSASPVKQVWVAASKYEDCPVCNGSGNVNGNPCEKCDGDGELKVAAGARHSAGDVGLIQAVHDHAMTLGAKCDRGNYKLMAGHTPEPVVPVAATAAVEMRAACGCKEKPMSLTKDKKAEIIAALVTDQYSGFKEGDEKFLEAYPDERLEEFRTAAAGRKDASDAHDKLVNDQRNVAARLKVAEDKLKNTEDALKTAQQKPTKEQWLEVAPPEVKALLEAEEKRNTEHRAELITHLKTAQAEFTEDDLKTMELSMLERLAKAVKPETVSYSGRAVPQPRAAARNDVSEYAAPNPYEKDIAALQGASKAVN